MVICERCKSDLAPIKTFVYMSPELHFAKCVFGTLMRVNHEKATQDTGEDKELLYKEDQDFVELQWEMWQEELREMQDKGKVIVDDYGMSMDSPDYFAFCECRKKHIVGVVRGMKYYLTDISQV